LGRAEKTFDAITRSNRRSGRLNEPFSDQHQLSGNSEIDSRHEHQSRNGRPPAFAISTIPVPAVAGDSSRKLVMLT
jgi:hypothetical protein